MEGEMKIQILGPVRNKCTRLAVNTTAAIEKMGVNYVTGKICNL
jgi:hypothetical protein